MNTIHLMVGIQGSGKTTFSKKLSEELGIKIISTDEVRKQNPNIKEEMVWPLAYDMCANEIKNNKDVIFDATSITPKVRKRLYDNIKERTNNFQIGCYFFKVGVKVCKSRVAKRNNIEGEINLPLEVVEKFNNSLVFPTYDEPIVFIKVINELGNIVDETTKL